METEEPDFKLLKLTADIRQFEIGLFWSRSLFFWGFSTVAVTAYGAAHHFAPKEVQFAVACAGLVCSVIWTLVNRSSKYWQKVWEEKAENVSRKVVGYNLFEQPPIEELSCRELVDRFPWWSAHFSVSKLAIAFSDFAVLVWFGLAYKATSFGVWPPPEYWIRIAGFCTAVYIVYVFFRCRSDKRENSDQNKPRPDDLP